MPPVEAACINEKVLRTGTWTCNNAADGKAKSGELDQGLKWTTKLDDESSKVPFATWDPDKPNCNTTPYSHLARPVRVTLNEGDMLYLPAMW